MWLLLKWKLKASDPAKRIAAINEMATSRDPRAATSIAETLVRAIDLAKAASNRPDGSKGDPVKDIIDNANVQQAAAEALGELGDSSALDALLRALGEGQEPYARRAVVTALGRMKDKRSVEPLVARMSRDFPYGRWLLAPVAAALGEIGDPAALGPLQSWLEESRQRLKSLQDSYVGDSPVNRQLHEESLRDVYAALEEIPVALRKLGKTAHP